MDGVNVPKTFDWFSACLLPVSVAVFATVLGQLIERKIVLVQALKALISVVLSVLVLAALWYNGIGYVVFLYAQNQKTDKGCLQAMPVYQTAVRWNPMLGDAREGLISCGKELNREQDVSSFLSSLEGSLSETWQYWRDIAQISHTLGDHDRVYAAAVRSLSLEPLETSWIVDIGYRYVLVADYIRAEVILRRVRVYNWSDSFAIYWLGWAIFGQAAYSDIPDRQAKYSDAFDHFEQCLTKFQVGHYAARCHAGKGFIFRNLGQTSEARAEFTRSLELQADQEDVLEALASLP